ncbi:hypothetical protein MBH78_11155 [Oceanimonas sp. NS1]|uniref:WD40 repeat domain-containing protein n=1 Tax=Oceanimonas sp. MB9 TaxID=2588453 RepID=UPI0013F5BBD3|nr:hypothetical protein [Oceanimonas sp. MB9]MCT7655104.1 hypothetical protein [Oceanimonas sp. NS1]NHH99570.1 hypothetical protein [Oceanimonas sp. MB9]
MRNPFSVKTRFGQAAAATIVMLLLAGCDRGVPPAGRQSFTDGSLLAADTTADGRHTLIATGNGPVQVWRQGGPAPLFLWHQGQESTPVVLLASSPGGDTAATATDGTVALWSLQNGQNLGFYRLEQPLRALALADAGRALLLGYQNGEAEYVDLTSGRRLTFLGHDDRINSLDLSANGRYALSASHDGEVLLWQTSNAAILARWRHEHSVSLVRLDANGRAAFSADAQGRGELRRLPGGELQARLEVPARGQTFVSARLNVEQNLLATGGTARRLDLWRLSDGAHLNHWRVGLHTQLRPASAMVYSVAFTAPDRLYSVSSAGLGETWTLTDRDHNDE